MRLGYAVRQGLCHRRHLIYLKPDSEQSRRLADLARDAFGASFAEGREMCEEIVREIEEGALDAVERALCGGDVGNPARDELPSMLQDAVAFAQSLQRDGALSRLRQEDLVSYLRALVTGASEVPGWGHAWVTCRKE